MTTQNSEPIKNKINRDGLKFIIKHNKSVNSNTELLDTLKKSLPQFIDSHENFKTDSFLAELKRNNIAESRDSYKLNFVGKDYARLQTGCKPESMIAPDIKHNAQNENKNSENIFVTGDNLDVLRHLQNAYARKIKMIYIDPPYNTGTENFTYKDKFEFSDEKLKSMLGYTDDEIKRLKLIQGKSSHSAWLTFMYPRLKLAQKLLTDDGVIFVSIDDNEQANLKLLMDDVFGEGNFVGNSVLMNNRGGRDYGGIAKQHEYILIYSKNIDEYEINLIEEIDKNFLFYDNDGGYNLMELRNRNVKFNDKNRPNLFYPFYMNPNKQYDNGLLEISLEKKAGFIEVLPAKSQGIQTVWRWGKEEKARQNLNKEIFGKVNQNGGYMIVQKYRKTAKMQRSIWDEKEFVNERGTEVVKELLGNNYFDYPKSIFVIKRCLELASDKDSLILDFFAGSGTTAHAVMQLNADDGGDRKFILVQIDEPTNLDSEACKAGYKTIDEIARERIRHAATKIKSEKGLALPENFDGGFKHYKIVAPDVMTLDKIEKFDPEQEQQKDFFDDMVTAFDDKITGAKGEEVILQTWLIHDGNTFDQQPQVIDINGYQAYYIDESLLYLIRQGWDVQQTKKLLNAVGTHQLNLNTIIIYGYSFAMESLRELELGVKQALEKPVSIKKRY